MIVTNWKLAKISKVKTKVQSSSIDFQIRALVFDSPFRDTFLVNFFEMKSPLKQNAISNSSSRSLSVRITGLVMVRLETVFITYTCIRYLKNKSCHAKKR